MLYMTTNLPNLVGFHSEYNDFYSMRLNYGRIQFKKSIFQDQAE